MPSLGPAAPNSTQPVIEDIWSHRTTVSVDENTALEEPVADHASKASKISRTVLVTTSTVALH